tara:strand:+ start:1870 stop:2115 length:246 start_codon:yes stop_codon:yes gene_type:complete
MRTVRRQALDDLGRVFGAGTGQNRVDLARAGDHVRAGPVGVVRIDDAVIVAGGAGHDILGKDAGDQQARFAVGHGWVLPRS